MDQSIGEVTPLRRDSQFPTRPCPSESRRERPDHFAHRLDHPRRRSIPSGAAIEVGLQEAEIALGQRALERQNLAATLGPRLVHIAFQSGASSAVESGHQLILSAVGEVAVYSAR